MPIWFKTSHSFGHNLKFSNEKCKVVFNIYNSRYINGTHFGQGLPFAILSQIFDTLRLWNWVPKWFPFESWKCLGFTSFQFFQTCGNVLGAFSRLISHFFHAPTMIVSPRLKSQHAKLGEIILYIFYFTKHVK